MNIDKFDSNTSSMICPSEMNNLNTAGTVYLVQYKPKFETGLEITDDKTENKTYYAFSIDVTGSSTETEFISTHYDLFVRSSTDHTTFIQTHFRERKWTDYSLVLKVGQIPINDILICHIPDHFVRRMECLLIDNVYDILYNQNNGAIWSSILNCQTFTRAAITYLGFEFPSSVHIISDCIPTMFAEVQNLPQIKISPL